MVCPRGRFWDQRFGKEILPSPPAKSLGVVMDSHLSFDELVTDLVSRGTGSLSQIGRVKYLFYNYCRVLARSLAYF